MGTLSGRSRSDALLLTLALLLGLGGCSSDPDEASTASASGSGPASVSGGASHSTTATSDASATGSASGSTATATTGVSQTGGTSSASGTATTGLPELPCDPGFMFAPSPAETGAALVASFTHAEPLAYVELTIEGPGQASTTWAGITTEDPWTWSWHVHNLSPGIYAATFSAGDPASEHGTCQFQAIDTGPPPDPPPDTTGGGEVPVRRGRRLRSLPGRRRVSRSAVAGRPAGPWHDVGVPRQRRLRQRQLQDLVPV